MSTTPQNDLLLHLNSLHTTEMGTERIRKNLSISTDDVVDWCREKILDSNADIVRRGKNFYISIDNCIITVNAHSYTIITAHKSSISVQ